MNNECTDSQLAIHSQPTFYTLQAPCQPVSPPCSQPPNQHASLLVRNAVSQPFILQASDSAGQWHSLAIEVSQPTSHIASLAVMPPTCFPWDHHDPTSSSLHFPSSPVLPHFLLTCLHCSPRWPLLHHQPGALFSLPFFVFLMCKKGRPVRIV